MINNQLDKTDRRILTLLQQNCRMTHKAIAHHLNMSLTPVHVRIRRLEEEGYIQRYVALIKPLKVGIGVIAYTQVQVKPHTHENLLNFVRDVTGLPEVMECTHVSGKFDFLLKVAVRDMYAFNQLLVEKLARLPNVDNMESLFAISQPKYETAYMVQMDAL